MKIRKKQISMWFKFRVWIGLLILPTVVKKHIAACIFAPPPIIFESTDEFAKWLDAQKGMEKPTKIEVH